MNKNWRTRLQETIHFIRMHPVPNLRDDAGHVGQALTRWVNTSNQAQALSAVMSQAHAPNRPVTKLARDYRRAAIMLRAVFPQMQRTYQQIAADINRYGGTPHPDYQLELEHARDAVYGSTPAVAHQELDLLFTRPRYFLERWRLIVLGRPHGGIKNYKVRMEDGVYYLDPQDTYASQVIQRAWNIPARSFAAYRHSLDSLPASKCEARRSHLALTTQFTGCAFCFETSGNTLNAIHLDPTAAPTGGKLPEQERKDGAYIRRKLLAGSPGFANALGGEFRVFGRATEGEYGYPNGNVIIVSVFMNNAWRVYAQIYSGLAWSVYRIDGGTMKGRTV